MRIQDLYYRTGSTTIFYSSIHAIRNNEIRVDTDWWETSEETISEVLDGKLRYEQLKLIVSPEEINELLEKALTENSLKSTIEKALDSSLEQMKVDIDRVTTSFKRAIPKVQDAIEEMSKAVASTSSYKRTIDSTTRAIEQAKENIPPMDSVKESLLDAKKEFKEVTDKLNTEVYMQNKQDKMDRDQLLDENGFSGTKSIPYLHKDESIETKIDFKGSAKAQKVMLEQQQKKI